MNELEELKKKRLEELQKQQQQEMQREQQQQMQLQQQVQQLEAVVRQVLTREAWQRYCTLKLAHTEKALQALVVVAQMTQAQGLKHMDDHQFKEILKKIEPEKKEFKINK